MLRAGAARTPMNSHFEGISTRTLNKSTSEDLTSAVKTQHIEEDGVRLAGFRYSSGSTILNPAPSPKNPYRLSCLYSDVEACLLLLLLAASNSARMSDNGFWDSVVCCMSMASMLAGVYSI